MLGTILQQMVEIVYGATAYLPATKYVIAIAVGILLLIYLKGTVGGLVASILVTILIGKSFFSQGDIYQISFERAAAGLILGLLAFFVNLYFLVRTLADWRD